jgi:isopenicillin-N epimerase
VALPFPDISEEGALLAIERGLTARARLAIVDHVTSGSALVMPVAAIAELCRKHGVALLVDGAHAVGAIPVDLPAIGADWYTGNLHKWGWAPRSSAILWVDPARQAQLHPTTISWGLDQGFTAEFDWLGTRDPTPWLAAPAALSLMQELGLEAVRTYNHELAWFAGNHLAECWRTPWTVPRSMVGTMVTVPVPDALGATQADAERLRDALLFDEHIEVQLHAAHGRVWARVSAQIYNERSDIERLARAVLARVPLKRA